MNYNEIFRPIFSFGAHAAIASGAWSGEAPLDARAVYADLERLITEAMAHRRAANAANFDNAWFAVAAWLDEKLSTLRASAGSDPSLLLQRRFFKTVNAGEEFFDRLNVILERESESDDPEIMSVVDVYGSCLDLGFLGRYFRPEDRPEIEIFRRRCLDIYDVEDAGWDDSALLQTGEQGELERSGPVRMTMFWVVPSAVTIGLYLLYRVLLHDLYAHLLG